MTESVENLVLEHLWALRSKIEEMSEDVREIKHRVVNLEAGQGTITQHIGHLQQTIAGQQLSFDRLSERVERLEKRLELA